MKVGFFGTPHLASRVLSDLIASSGIDVAFVVTNPDKPIGRSQTLIPSPVKAVAIEKGIDTYTPERIRKNHEFMEKIGSYECDYYIVVAYGKILPKSVLESPKKMCINIHGSLLPAYRGASPIQAALLGGEKETGVTIMQMSEGMDEGGILKIRTIEIAPDETSETLFEKFAEISGPTLIQTLQELEHGGITPLPQDHARATYCTKIEKEDGLIDWSKSAKTIYHMWQGYTPWPGIYTMYEGKRLLLEKVSWLRHPEQSDSQYTPSGGGSRKEQEQLDSSNTPGFLPSQEGQKPGTVIKLDNGRIGVICGEGILTLEQVKLEGKKSQNIRDFVNGNQKFISFIF